MTTDKDLDSKVSKNTLKAAGVSFKEAREKRRKAEVELEEKFKAVMSSRTDESLSEWD